MAPAVSFTGKERISVTVNEIFAQSRTFAPEKGLLTGKSPRDIRGWLLFRSVCDSTMEENQEVTMSSPLLKEKRISEISRGFASDPQSVSQPMSVEGAIKASALLVIIMAVSAAVSWLYLAAIPFLFPVSLLAGLVLLAVTLMKPKMSPTLAPVYAVCEGMVLGFISRLFEDAYSGIVLQALGATVAVFMAAFTLYSTGVIKVTARMRSTIVLVTAGVALFYLVALVASFFGVQFSVMHSSSLASIGFSVMVSFLAASSLLLDFDSIERGARETHPKYMEWYYGLGLLVSIVWLYLEILRLLAKSKRRN